MRYIGLTSLAQVRLPIVALALLVALTVSCAATSRDAGAPPRAATAGETQRVRLVGSRTAVASVLWRGTLEARPTPARPPAIHAMSGRSLVNARVRRVGAGRYALTVTFPTPGRWSISARVDGRRHSLGAVVVTAARVRLRSVFGLALHPGGGLLIADGEANRVVRADLQNGRLTTFASNGLSTPTGVAVAPDGTVYVADADARAVFRVAGGGVTRVMQYAVPLDVAVDSQGNLFTTGRENTVIRVDAATGTATRYAGTGEAGSSGNGGPALDARLATPHGITVDPNDNVVIAEDGSVRRIDRATSTIRAIAGSGQRSLCGERGAAFEVCMTAIRVAFEADGDFYVADPENARLWHIADGDAQALNLGFRPFAVVVETETTILLADSPNRRVVRYDVRTGVVETVVR